MRRMRENQSISPDGVTFFRFVGCSPRPPHLSHEHDGCRLPLLGASRCGRQGVRSWYLEVPCRYSGICRTEEDLQPYNTGPQHRLRGCVWKAVLVRGIAMGTEGVDVLHTFDFGSIEEMDPSIGEDVACTKV